jgi:hypothetical protein
VSLNVRRGSKQSARPIDWNYVAPNLPPKPVVAPNDLFYPILVVA